MDTLHVDLSHPLRSFDLELTLDLRRETLALAGPSGAGKSSVLRVVSGLLAPRHGRVVADRDVWLDTAKGVDLPPERRSIGLVFQDYALFPHLTVHQNVAYGGKTRAAELLERFGLAPLAHVRPGELSGGERQRVALARALARQPSVLLLDEPLSALDAHTRMKIRAELHEHLREAALPTLIVTHDYADAAALADRVAVLVEGRLAQVATPAELLARPASTFVADFTGANLLHGHARDGAAGLTEVVLEDGTTLVSVDPARGAVGVVIHPWDVVVGRELPSDSAQNHVAGPVVSLAPVGNRVRVRVGPLTAELTAASVDRLALRPGQPVVATFKATATRLVPL
jgi:molybdate transport system ATP-binding protein